MSDNSIDRLAVESPDLYNAVTSIKPEDYDNAIKLLKLVLAKKEAGCENWSAFDV